MHNPDGMKICDPLGDIAYTSSLEEFLSELSTIVAKALNARQCAISMLSERQLAEMSLHQGAEFGVASIARYEMVSMNRYGTRGRYPLVSEGVPALATSMETGSEAYMRSSMFSALVLRGKPIGIVYAYQPLQKNCFSAEDLQLLENLALLIVKVIQANQIQQLMKSRFTQVALTRSSEKTVREIIAGSVQNTNQIARILAKSFYREMTNAGFNFNQIIHAASEIISELSNSVRKHKNSHSRRVKIDNPGDDVLSPGSTNASYSREDEVMNELLNRPG